MPKPSGDFLKWYTSYLTPESRKGFYFGFDNDGTSLGVWDLKQQVEISKSGIFLILLYHAAKIQKKKADKARLAKAKALRGFVEPIITKSKTDSTHSRRAAFRYLQNKDAVNELFREIAPKVIDRNGGYTRIIRTGYRFWKYFSG